MTLRTATKYFMYASDEPAADKLGTLRQIGVAGVEVLTQPAEEARAFSKAANAAGVAVPTVIAEQTFFQSATNPDASVRDSVRANVVRAIETAQEVGANVVMVCPGMAREDLRPSEQLALSSEVFEEPVALAQRQGITLAIENLWNGWLTSACDLGSYARANGMSVAFDTGNAARVGPPQHAIIELGDLIVRMDVKDYRRSWFGRPASVYAEDAEVRAVWGEDGPWGALDVLPMDGDLNWDAIADAVVAIGYDNGGWICAEHGGGDYATLADLNSRLSNFVGIVDRRHRSKEKS